MAGLFKAAARVRNWEPKAPLRRSDASVLPFLTRATAGNGLLLDTCVYIDQLRGAAPQAVEDLLNLRTVHHSTIALQELMYPVGALNPSDPRSRSAIEFIGRMVDAIPAHRLFAPDPETLAAAAVLAGILGRTQSYAKDDRLHALHDCGLFLQALRMGLTILTRNTREFGLLLSMRTAARVVFYRI